MKGAFADPLVINPGELRHRIEIQEVSSTAQDPRGKSVNPKMWDKVLSCWAKIEGAGSRTFRMSFSNNAQVSLSTDVITIRWPGSNVVLKPGQRVQFNSNLFNIDAVDNVQHRNRKVVLACTQISADSN
ncbi:phage head closure protein [Occallatibacter riparius]|uniref:Phage head closure protein n=1 Tax=Occallatibacter riparius TaxID=1002689 RepID=A0A9J7BPL2_9BACT|nr:phage head closure protein [Occallatibacter riparius]UWZ84648.1 phage head closure protein [Occallatibacter riparius]